MKSFTELFPPESLKAFRLHADARAAMQQNAEEQARAIELAAPAFEAILAAGDRLVRASGHVEIQHMLDHVRG